MKNTEFSLRVSEITKKFNQDFAKAKTEVEKERILRQYHKDVAEVEKEYKGA